MKRIEDELPPLDVKVLLWVDGMGFTIGERELDRDDFATSDDYVYRIGNDYIQWDYHYNTDISIDTITHWQHLPEDVSQLD